MTTISNKGLPQRLYIWLANQTSLFLNVYWLN